MKNPFAEGFERPCSESGLQFCDSQSLTLIYSPTQRESIVASAITVFPHIFDISRPVALAIMCSLSTEVPAPVGNCSFGYESPSMLRKFSVVVSAQFGVT